MQKQVAWLWPTLMGKQVQTPTAYSSSSSNRNSAQNSCHLLTQLAQKITIVRLAVLWKSAGCACSATLFGSEWETSVAIHQITRRRTPKTSGYKRNDPTRISKLKFGKIN